MKKIAIALVMLFAVSSVFAQAAREILDKALDISVLLYGESRVSSVYVVDTIQYVTGGSMRMVRTVDGDNFRMDTEMMAAGNVIMTGTSIYIPGKGLYVSANGGAYRFMSDKNDMSKQEFSDFSKIIRDAGEKYTITFDKENSSNSKNYVINMELKEEYAKEAGKKNKDAGMLLSGLSMLKYKFYVDRTTNLITQYEMTGDSDFIGGSVVKLSDYKKIPGTNYYYPYTADIVSSFGGKGEGSAVVKVQSFKVVKSKDITSSFDVSAAAINKYAILGTSDTNKTDKDFDKEMEEIAKDEAKQQVKDEAKKQIKKGIGGVLRGLGGF